VEFVLVAIVLLIAVAVVGGVVVSMAREGGEALASPLLDRLRAAARAAAPPRSVAESMTGPGLAAGGSEPPPAAAAAAALRLLGDDFHAAARVHDSALSRLEDRLERGLEGLRRDLDGDRDRLGAGLARLQAGLDGPRAEPAATRERRAETVAELYARLARLEAAIAAATNPVLLPGEPYAPPAELPPEALAWEHWKDVGERAFAFAEHFNANRLRLDPPLATEIAAFLARLRGALTGEVYPNLRPAPAPEELRTLRAALDRLAADLPDLRHRLDEAYRVEVGTGDRPA